MSLNIIWCSMTILVLFFRSTCEHWESTSYSILRSKYEINYILSLEKKFNQLTKGWHSLSNSITKCSMLCFTLLLYYKICYFNMPAYEGKIELLNF